MPSAQWQVSFFVSSLDSFSFSCLIAVTRTSNTRLNLCLLLILKEKLSTSYHWVYGFSPLVLPVGMPHMASIILRYALSTTTLLSAFITNKCWILSKVFSAFIDMIIWSLFSNLLTWCVILMNFWISNHPWDKSRDKSHVVMVYVKYCWIWLPDICWGFCSHIIQWHWDKSFSVCAFSAIPLKIPTAFLTELEQLTLKLVWKHKKRIQKNQIAKKALRQNKAGGITHAGFKLHCKASVIKTVWCWTKDRHIHQSNKEHKINQCFLCGQLIYDPGGKNIKSGKTVSLTNSIGKTGQLHAKESNRTAFSHQI